MLKHTNKALLIFLVFLLVINTVAAQQHSKVNSVQDCLDLYEGSFSCFRILAERTNDVSLCDYPVEKPVSVEEKNRCVRYVAAKNKNINACDTLAGKEKDSCIYGVAYELQDEILCELISDETIRKGCQWEILQFKDYECSDLWDNLQRDFCYGGRCQTVECCQNIKGLPESEARRNSCIARIGGQSGDLSLCIQTKKRKCVLDAIASLESPSPKVCDQFKNLKFGDEYYPDSVSVYLDCIGGVAKNNKDLEICLNTFNTQKDIDNCLIRVKQIEACEQISDTKLNADCVKYIVKYVSHNINDCNSIIDPKEKRSCRTLVSPKPNWVVNLLLLLIIIGTYFAFLKNKKEYLPWTIGIGVILIQRIILLLASLSFIERVLSIMPLLAFVWAVRFTDLFLSIFTGLRGYIPYDWLYLLIIDIITLLSIVLVGYAAKKKGMNVLKTTLIFIAILTSIAFLLLLLFAYAMAG